MDKQEDINSLIPTYKGIIFDFDGTLVDLNVDWEKLKNELSQFCLEKFNKTYFFSPLDPMFEKIKEIYGESAYSELIKIIENYEGREEKYVINKLLISQINALQYKKIAIYSMNTKQTILKFLKKYVTIKPDIIISKENCIESKPTDKDLKWILKKWKLNNNEVLFIGNSELDLESGKRANIVTKLIKI